MNSYKRRINRRIESRRKHCANMRAAKARLCLASPPPDHEPEMQRAHRYQITVTDTYCHESGTFAMRSIRDVVRRLATMRRYYT